MDLLDMLQPQGGPARAEAIDRNESSIVQPVQDVLGAMLQAGKSKVVQLFRETDVGRSLETEARNQAVADYWRAFATSPITWAVVLFALYALMRRRG
jgi:uncharacterized protein (TIGR03382 family)